MKKSVIALSGGIDSCVAATMELERQPEKELYCISFKYPAKHNTQERLAALNIVCSFSENYGADRVSLIPVDASAMFTAFQSNLLQNGDKIPEGHYTDENQRLTVVPGRNTLFAAYMMGFAQSNGADKIILGIHRGDHAIYPDCRPEWFHRMNSVVRAATEGAVLLEAPLLNYDKREIVRDGLFIGAPLHLTWTCYKGELVPCGVCGSCVERREAFELNGFKDPAWK